MGATAPGWYNLDPSGNMMNNDDEFFCKDGWTYMMMREPSHSKLRSIVSYFGAITSSSVIFSFDSLQFLRGINEYKKGFRVCTEGFMGLDALKRYWSITQN